MDGRAKATNTLPKLRNDITVAFHDYDIEGRPQWIIHDAGRNKFFLIGWQEFEIYQRWALNSKTGITESINNQTTLHVDESDIENFIQFLQRNYLIEMSGYAIHNQAKEQRLFKKDSLFHWLIDNYLFFRIPLVKPDDFLSRTKIVGSIVFSKILLYIMSALGLLALFQISSHWEQFAHTFPSIFSLKGLFFSLIAFLICKCCHELGHAYMCKRYGVPVPTFGVAFLVFWPVLYTDTTLSWSLTHKQRLRIAIAGIWVETYITIIAALIWSVADNQTIKTICFVTISVNWLASVLLNVSPFMRFDGYYVLADYWKMPNLQFRAFALTRWQLRRWLFGWNEPPPEKFSKRMHRLLIAYSVTTWIYRLIIYIGIAILVYHFFAKVVGIILFIIELYYFILAPFVHEFRYWFENRKNFTFNLNTKISLSIFFTLIIIFFLPFENSVKIPSTVRFTHEFLVAPEAGILTKNLPPVGTQIEANQVIATIESPQLNQALLETQLEYNKTVSQLRRSDINPDYIGQKNILLSDIKRLKAEYQKLLNVKYKLSLSVPFSGILVEVATDVASGAYLMKGQWLGDVINPDSISIEAYAPQSDINYVQIGNTGYFYPNDFDLPKIPVTVKSIEVMNAKEFDCRYSTQVKQQKNETMVVETPCYHASDLGGDIPTYLTDQGNYAPTESVYRVILTTPSIKPMNYVERGTAFLRSKPQSYARRIFYKIKTIFIEELGF